MPGLSKSTVCSGAVVFLAALLGAQAGIDPNELRISSAPYIPPSSAAFRSDTRLVEVLAVVRDNKGQPIAGLTRSDFEIRDEGKKREVSAFSVQQRSAPVTSPVAVENNTSSGSAPPARPRTISLLFDDLNSAPEDFQHVRDAALKYLHNGLAPGDRVGIFTTFGLQVQPFTTNINEVTETISKLNPRIRAGRTESCPTLNPYFAYVIAFNLDREVLTAKVLEMQQCDPGSQAAPPPPGRNSRASSAGTPVFVSVEDPTALKVIRLARQIWAETEITSKNTLDVIEKVVDLTAAQPGEHMILLGSGGFLAGSLQDEQHNIISRAVHAGVVINALDAKGLFTGDFAEAPAVGLSGRAAIYATKIAARPKEATSEIMANIADGTGGRFFQNNNDLAGGFTQLTQIPEVSYLLGFQPSNSDGKFHRLKIEAPLTKHATVQARLGYFAAPENQPREERKIDREVFTSSQAQDAPIGLGLTSEPVDNGGSVIKAVFHADVRTLPFVEKSGVRTEKLSFVLALLDQDGSFVSGKEGSMEFALKDTTYKRLQGTRLDANLQLPMPVAGTYRVRVLVEEANGGRMTEASQTIRLK